MDRHMILYRGSLKSCNYHCSYCPFSKRPMSARELENDRIQWFSFVQSLPEKAEKMQIGALMVGPYGEEMIHPWYWEGLAQLSACAKMDAVGIQTNLSFGAEESLKVFRQSGSHMEKLRLWLRLASQCQSLKEFQKKKGNCKVKLLETLERNAKELLRISLSDL